METSWFTVWTVPWPQKLFGWQQKGPYPREARKETIVLCALQGYLDHKRLPPLKATVGP
jgi:hypothetical protein